MKDKTEKSKYKYQQIDSRAMAIRKAFKTYVSMEIP